MGLLIKDSLANKISYYHLMLLMASLPFDRFYSHLILVSFAIHTLIHLKKNAIKPVFKLRTFALQSAFFVTLLSTIYTINTAGAFDEWGKRITILLFPVFFCLNPLDIKKYRPQLLMSFALVCTATIVYLYMDALITIRHYKLPFSTLFSASFTNHNFSQPIDMHATFFSMQVALSLIYMLSVLISERSFYSKLIYWACCIILSAGLIQLCSKSVFIVLMIVINIAMPWFLLKGARRLKFIMVSAGLSVLVVIGILSSGTLKDRYVNELRTDLSKSPIGQTTDSRLARWNVAIELIGKAPVIGYGAGSEIGLLQESFFNKKLYNSYLNRLNAHSQYLSFLLKSGIIGFLLYIGTLAFGFNISIRQKDLLFLTFMALIAIVSLSENLLDVDKGIFFYAFFFSFFIFSNEQTVNSIVSAIKRPSVMGQKPQVLREKQDLRLGAKEFKLL
jgi:O-antigen ligase